MPVDNKAIARRIIDEIINTGNFTTLNELVTENIIDHQTVPGIPSGREGMQVFVSTFRAAFPDLRYTVDDSIEEGDRVVQRMTARGTMKGDFMGMPASGKSAAWQEIHITRFANGKAAEHWGIVDQVSMLTQLGFMSQPQGAPAGR